MKYLTKQWYEAMQKSDMYLPLKTSKRAEVFSEEYYNELYKQKELEWLKLKEDMSNVKFEDTFPEYANQDFSSEEEYKEYEELLMRFNEMSTFNPTQEKENFKQLQENCIKNLKCKLPSYILEQVADIRVLALDRASDTVKKAITNYCNEQNMIVQKASREYREYYDKAYKDDIMQALNLHDCLITNIIKGKEKLVIELDCSEGFGDIKTIIFEDYKIIEEETDFVNGWWLEQEIYIIGNQYELHILINVPSNKKESKLGYLTIRAQDIILK